MRTSALAACLALTVALAAGCAARLGEAAPSAATTPVTVMLADFEVGPVELTVSGPSVTFAVTNNGPTVHNFSIRNSDGEVVLATPDLRPGERATLTGELPAGDYETFCSLPGHDSLGMLGTLTVTDR